MEISAGQEQNKGKQRPVLDIKTKAKILEAFKKGEKQQNFVQDYGIIQSKVSHILYFDNLSLKNLYCSHRLTVRV